MAFLEVGQRIGRAVGAAEIRVDFVRDWKQVAWRLPADSHRTIFQHSHWLSAWYESFAAVTPVIAVASDVATGRPLAIVPLIRREHHGIQVAEFADLVVSDYNAPILSGAAPDDEAGARRVGRALVAALRALPEQTDLLRMRKMPMDIDGKPNPLALLGVKGSSSLNGNLVEIGENYEDYQNSIKRMQMPRCWRVFSRHPHAEFKIIDSVDEALEVLETTDGQQHERMDRLGLNFVLDQGDYARFYRNIVKRGLADRYPVVSVLRSGTEIVATAFGVRWGINYSLLRTSNAGKQWAPSSPGLLCVERTMAKLHEDGVRRFDLSIGNSDYKRRFGAKPLPLTDVSIALSWRGLPYALRDRTAQEVRRYRRFVARLSNGAAAQPTQ